MQTCSPEVVFIVGTVGGVSPDLEACQLVVADQLGEPGAIRPAARSVWLDRAMALEEVIAARVISVDRILSSSEEKADFWRQHSGGRPTVVDLESATIARHLESLEVPYVLLRAVSDSAREDLPLDFNRFRDRRGGIRRSRILLHALLKPNVLGELNRLRVRVDRCGVRLAEAVLQLLDNEQSP